MLTNGKRIKALTEALEAEKKANIALNTHNKALQAAFKKSACLIGIERGGNTNKFTFVRNEEFFTIETYSTMSDDVDEWKEKAGIK